MNSLENDAIRAAVRDHYASVATGAPVPNVDSGSGCCAPSCCGGATSTSLKVGYSEDDITAARDVAARGLGGGNTEALP